MEGLLHTGDDGDTAKGSWLGATLECVFASGCKLLLARAALCAGRPAGLGAEVAAPARHPLAPSRLGQSNCRAITLAFAMLAPAAAPDGMGAEGAIGRVRAL